MRATYRIDMQTGVEGEVASYPAPEQLWNLTFAEANAWRDRAIRPLHGGIFTPALTPASTRMSVWNDGIRVSQDGQDLW